jgi:hypothetical protein
MQNVYGWQEPNEKEKLYFEAQKVMETEIEKIKRGPQGSQRSHQDEGKITALTLSLPN